MGNQQQPQRMAPDRQQYPEAATGPYTHQNDKTGHNYQNNQTYQSHQHQAAFQSHSPTAASAQTYYPDGFKTDAAHAPHYLDPFAQYDTEPPKMASKHRQSWYDWMMARPPILVSPAELRDERYVSYIISMHKVLIDFEERRLTDEQALKFLEHYMAKIRGEVGHVDDLRTDAMLNQLGYTYQERADMQREYEDLKKRCGQKVPQFKKNMNPITATMISAGLVHPGSTHAEPTMQTGDMMQTGSMNSLDGTGSPGYSTRTKKACW